MHNSCTLKGPSLCHLEDGSCPWGWRQLSPALGTATRLVRAPHNKGSALPPSYLFSPCPLLLCARQVNPAKGSVIYRCWRNDFWILRFRRQKTNLLKTNLFILLLNFSANADREPDPSASLQVTALLIWTKSCWAVTGVWHGGALWLSTSCVAFCTFISPPSPSLLSQLMAYFFSPHVGFF